MRHAKPAIHLFYLCLRIRDGTVTSVFSRQKGRGMPSYDTESSPSSLDLRSLSHEELLTLVTELGWPSFRAKQVEDWLWKHHVSSFDEMTNVPAELRKQLAERGTLGDVSEVTRQVSNDGSRKYLIEYADGTRAE